MSKSVLGLGDGGDRRAASNGGWAGSCAHVSCRPGRAGPRKVEGGEGGGGRGQAGWKRRAASTQAPVGLQRRGGPRASQCWGWGMGATAERRVGGRTGGRVKASTWQAGYEGWVGGCGKVLAQLKLYPKR